MEVDAAAEVNLGGAAERGLEPEGGVVEIVVEGVHGDVGGDCPRDGGVGGGGSWGGEVAVDGGVGHEGECWVVVGGGRTGG